MRKSRLFSPDFEIVSKLSRKFRGQILKTLALGVTGVLAGTLGMAQLSGGTYTINSGSPTGGGNYNSFGDFVSALASNSNAIGGAITVNVVANSGPYTEQIVLPSISGTGPGPGGTRIGITFNGNGETITYNGGSTENATITLNGADYITFQDLVIERGSSGSYRWGVRLTNNANNNRFDGCTIDVGQYSTSYQIPILGSASNTSYSSYGVHYNGLEIWDCEIIGGYGGVWAYGPSATSGTWCNGIEIKNCTFTDQYYYPIRLYYGHYNVNIEGNYFHKPNQSYAYGYATYIYRANNLTMTKNHNVGFAYGFLAYYINYYNTGLVSGRSLIANNMAAPNEAPASGATSRRGFYLYYNTDVDFYYNSVNLEGGLTSTCYTLYMPYSNSCNIKNNVFSSSTSGTNYFHYFYNPSGTYSSDYNTFWAPDQTGTMYFYYGTTSYNTISSFISSSGSNANSQEADPSFISTTDLHTNGANLYQKGTPVSVTDDFDGTARPVSMPSHGVHEFTPPQYDASVVTFNNPVAVCPDTNTIEVTILNLGTIDLSTVMLHWEYSGNGSPVTADSALISATVAIETGKDTLITIGSIPMTSGAPGYNFKAWTSKPNGNTDQNHSNDTAVHITQTAMDGSFTIGGTTPDFPTFTAAVNALNTYGVCGPVVFNVRQGTYTEQVKIAGLVGTSDVNTVTFQADTANTAIVQLEYNSTSYQEGTVHLDGANWITFDGITIEALSSSYGHTVTLVNAASNNTVRNCILNVPVTSTTSNYMANIYIYSSDADNNTIENNEMNNGSYGVYFYAYPQATGTQILGNTMNNMYYQGLYLYYQGDTKVMDNYIQAVGYQNSYGMYLYARDGNDVEIRRNESHSNYYGFYLYLGGTSQASPQVTNNKIHCGDTNLATSYAIYGVYYYGGYGMFAHNTVFSESNYTYQYYNMYFNGGLNESYNNIFARAGSGYAMYVGGSFSLTASDYNAYATYNGASNGLSYMTNLGHDANSLQIGGEIFSKTDSLYTCKDSLVGAGTFLADVPNDINMSARNQQGPTIGPEEYVTPNGFSLGDDVQICDGDTVYIGQEVSGGTYVWTPGGAVTGILPVTNPGTYSVQVTGACGVADDEIIVESGNSTAAFNTTPSWLTAQFTNTSLKATTYSWDFGDGSAPSTDMNPTHLYAATGTYTVCLTASGECGDNQTCQDVFVSDHIGIGENSASNVVNIYPNPASSDLNILVSGVEGNSLNIEISNVAGQVVLTRQLNDFNGSAKENVDINGLKEGVYFVKIFSSEMTTTKRLVVQQ